MARRTRSDLDELQGQASNLSPFIPQSVVAATLDAVALEKNNRLVPRSRVTGRISSGLARQEAQAHVIGRPVSLRVA